MRDDMQNKLETGQRSLALLFSTNRIRQCAVGPFEWQSE